MAKVIKEFKGCPDGEAYPILFKVGDEVQDGTDLHRVALEQGWCKAKPAPKNKARAVPKNKSGSASQAGHRSRKKTSRRSKTRT